ncbi:MAG: hypothetical protein WCJ35_23400 [Planctomycetota bacterium]
MTHRPRTIVAPAMILLVLPVVTKMKDITSSIVAPKMPERVSQVRRLCGHPSSVTLKVGGGSSALVPLQRPSVLLASFPAY